KFNVHDSRTLPMPAPPGRRMQAPEIAGPPVAEVLGNGAIDFLQQTGPGNAHLASQLHKPRKIVQVQVVCPVIAERINTYNGVKVVHTEGQRASICVDREDTIRNSGVLDSTGILPDAEPQVGGP